MAETCDAAISGNPGAFVRCTLPATDVQTCHWCESFVMWCGKRGHRWSALASLEGHKLLGHPERMPEAVADVARSPAKLDAVRRAAAGDKAAVYVRLVAALRAVGVSL